MPEEKTIISHCTLTVRSHTATNNLIFESQSSLDSFFTIRDAGNIPIDHAIVHRRRRVTPRHEIFIFNHIRNESSGRFHAYVRMKLACVTVKVTQISVPHKMPLPHPILIVLSRIFFPSHALITFYLGEKRQKLGTGLIEKVS